MKLLSVCRIETQNAVKVCTVTDTCEMLILTCVEHT